jgi:hypothetical protein
MTPSGIEPVRDLVKSASTNYVTTYPTIIYYRKKLILIC